MRNWIDLLENATTPAEALVDYYFDNPIEGVQVSLRETSSEEVEITTILVKGQKGEGLGSKTLSLLTNLADQYGVTLTLSPAEDATGDDGGLDFYGLIEWYERWGFVGGNHMVRAPNA